MTSASRAVTKLKLQSTSREFDSVQEAKSQEADQTRLQPDLDSERSEPVEVSPVQSSEDSTIAVPPMMPIAEPEIPLATSLRISDVVEPPEVEMHLSNEPKSEAHHAQSVMEEVGQLDQIENTIEQLTQQITDSDPLVRLAAVVELGDLAKQGQAIDRVVALLNQLTQDADLEVRVQAGASIAMIPVETTTPD
ncbi:MAG: hypothetical protein C4287_16705 [Leptolyngbya sp. ERB_1_2]